MIESNKRTLWLCTNCQRIMRRADAEKLSLAQGTSSGTTDWKCSSCGPIGQFVSESSPEFADFANDLIFPALAAAIQEAGYEALAYSAQCDKGEHGHCPGTNRLTAEWECLCECHRAKACMNDAPLISQNAAEGPWKNRISEEAVARILGLIAATPNRHRVRLEGDLVGHFDYWFDGGACAEMTGWSRFEFQDGTIAEVGITPVLSVDIAFPDGRRVQVQQHIQKS